jgi:CheY-like chemotaxis protein
MVGLREGHKVLVIDDDADIRESLREALEDAGYDVTTACNGREGLERLAQIGNPCVILLDLMMPVMSGPEFLQVLIEDKNHAPVVVVSAYGEIADPATGISDFIPKPVRLDRLLDAVSRYC